MGNEFLDNLPDLGLGEHQRKKKRRRDPEVPEAVIWQVVRCPKCKSDKTRVTTTKRPIRYHKCVGCGHLFKSVEQ